MVNRHRGEIEADARRQELSAVPHARRARRARACLRRGRHARRRRAFRGGRIAAKDAIRIIGAGLRGAGYELDDAAVAAMKMRGRRGRLRRYRGAAAGRDLHRVQAGADCRPFGRAPSGEVTPEGSRRPPEPFPWDAAMAAGLGTLRLAPRDFWSMTPRELDAALRGALGLVAASAGDERVPISWR